MIFKKLYKALYSIVWTAIHPCFFPVLKKSIRSDTLIEAQINNEGRSFTPFMICGPYGANNKKILDTMALCKRKYLIPGAFGFIFQGQEETKDDAMSRAFKSSRSGIPSWLGNNAEHCLMGRLLGSKLKNLVTRYDFIKSVKEDLGYAYIDDFKIIALAVASARDLDEAKSFSPWTDKTKAILEKGYIGYLVTETNFKYLLALIGSPLVIWILKKIFGNEKN